jgi:serine/threonine-protein phosphatase 2B catalytic subunit
MSRVFAVLREESEAVSELKSVNGNQRMPSNALANGADGVKDSIHGFGDARKSDIENERLPPDLIDAADVAGMEDFAPQSPSSPMGSPMSGIMRSDSAGDLSSESTSGPSSPGLPETPRRGSVPVSPVDGTPQSQPFRRGHARQSSLGTTMTSPSTRRRSLEGTLQMIRQAMDAKDHVIENLADEVAAGTAQDTTVGSPGRRGSISNSMKSPKLSGED